MMPFHLMRNGAILTLAILAHGAFASNGNYSWTLAANPAPWTGRGSNGIVVYDNKLWVLGGTVFSEPLYQFTECNDVWSSSDGINWTNVLPHAPWWVP